MKKETITFQFQIETQYKEGRKREMMISIKDHLSDLFPFDGSRFDGTFKYKCKGYKVLKNE